MRRRKTEDGGRKADDGVGIKFAPEAARNYLGAVQQRQDFLADVRGVLAELKQLWNGLPDRYFFAGLLLAWTALFIWFGNSVFGFVETRSLFAWMYDRFEHSPDDSYGLYVPLAVAGLLVWKRNELAAVPKRFWWPGALLLLLAVGLHVIGFAVQQTRVSILAYFGGVYALTGLFWGPRWLQATFFPMFLFAFCVPLGALADTLTLPLRMLVTAVSVGISHDVLGVEVFRRGSQILGGNGQPLYDVAPACSGIRSLVSMLLLVIIYGFMSFQATWKRLAMVLVALPLAVIGNVVRITIVIVVGEAFGHEAGVMIEQKFGFITFAVALACMLGLGELMRERKPAAPPAPAAPQSS